MEERLALATGATRGIGRRLVTDLRMTGWRVIATGRDAEALARIRTEEHPSDLVETAELDLDAAGLEGDATAALRGRSLDLLILNAARFAPWDETVATTDLASARAVFETDLFGSWRLVQAVLPALRSARGAIVAVGSGAGSHGDPDFGLSSNAGAASYAVAKAALHALMHKLSAELADDGVAVWVTDPGLTATAPGMADFGARPVAEGAASILAPLLRGLPSGTFTRDGAPLPW